MAAPPWSGAGLTEVAAPSIAAGTIVLTVGQGEQYATLGAALAAAPNGSVILVDAGTYVNDFGTVTSKVTIEGVGGIANFVATESPDNLKGILTVDDDATIENLSFSGSAISDADGGNGAGIRYEGGQLTLVNDSFSGNQDGILAAAVLPALTVNTISIDHSVFSDNGSGTGYTHNLYVGAVDQLTVTDSVFEGAVVGHELKSRALVNTIDGNVFEDGPTGTASYDIDLPDGGQDLVENNLIEKGPMAQNDALIHFGGEGVPYSGSLLTVTGNDLVDDLGSAAVGVENQTATSVSISDNTFSNFEGATIAEGPATETGNADENGNPIADHTETDIIPGSTVTYADVAPHSIVLGDAGVLAVQGGGGRLSAYADGGHVIAIGGSGGLDFSESATSGGNQITTLAGSNNSILVTGQDTIDSEGNDNITTGAGNITGQVGGTARILEAPNSSQWTVTGDAIITAQGGTTALRVGPSGTVTVGGSFDFLSIGLDGGAARFDVQQGGSEISASVVGGGVSLTVYNGALSATTSTAGAGATIQLGAGTAQVTSNGADQIFAGSGADTIIVSGAATIEAGTGSLAVYGHADAGGATIYGDGGDDLLGGDTGNLTYVGGVTDGTLELDLSGNTVQGGAGHLTILGGSRETIAGGAGGIALVCSQDQGGDAITTSAGASDTLVLGQADSLDCWGNDSISGGIGNQTMSIYGNSTITGSAGNSTVLLGGLDVYQGVGQDNVTVTAGASATLSVGLAMSVHETGADVLVASGSGAALATVIASGGAADIDTTSLGYAIHTEQSVSTTIGLNGGIDTVSLNGSDTIAAGSGSATVWASAANTSVAGGTGTLTVYDTDWDPGDRISVTGGAGALTYQQQTGQLVLVGGAGAASIDAGNGSAAITAGSGNITLRGGAAAVSFEAGTGNASLALGAGGGTIDFGAGSTAVTVAGGSAGSLFRIGAGNGTGGTDIITGFRTGTDHLTIAGTEQTISPYATSADFHLGDGTQIELLGIATG